MYENGTISNGGLVFSRWFLRNFFALRIRLWQSAAMLPSLKCLLLKTIPIKHRVDKSVETRLALKYTSHGP